MKKKKLIHIGGIASAIILILLLTWTWSLGAVASEDTQRTWVEAARGNVEWSTGTNGEWQAISGAKEVHSGDHIRTDEAGEASIRWGDRGITRLDPNTEITIETAATGEALFSSLLKIKVESGRVWNRVLKVLDIDGGMQVETSDVVATVRGTAFGIAKESASTDIAVTESVVSVPSALIREGQWGSFNASGTLALRQLTDADDWAIENKIRDQEFDAQMKKELMIRFQDRANANAPLWLMRLSEQGHLAVLAGDKKKDLAEKYALRHLAMGVLNEGKRDKHFDVLVKRAELADTRANRLLSETHAMSILLSTETYKDRKETGEMLMTLRDLRSSIAVFSESAALYREAISIDDRIDDYLFGPSTGASRSKNGRELLLDLADFAEALERRSDLSVPVREELRKKAEALGYRLGFDEFTPGSDHAFGDIPLAGEEQSTVNVTSTDSGSDEPEDESPEASRRFNAFQFYATPIKARVEEPVRLSLYGITPDGVAINITSEADFTIVEPISGEIQENYFFPSETGTVTLQAAIFEEEKVRKLTIQVIVEGEASLKTGIQDVQFEFQGPTDLSCSASVPFKVVAHYSDGGTKDVTIMSKKSVSNPNIIHVQDDKVLTYCPPETASAEVYATYEEGGQRFTAVGTITVTREPDPVRGTPGAPPTTISPPTTIF